MPHRDAFITEVAVDLEHPLKATHDQPLEVQLRRNTQKHLLIQRVVVGGKWPCIGAARYRVQHRCFHLQKVVRHHELADTTDRLAARHKALAGGLVHHQVDIALAVLDLLVGNAVELVWHRTQAFGQQAHLGGVD